MIVNITYKPRVAVCSPMLQQTTPKRAKTIELRDFAASVSLGWPHCLSFSVQRKYNGWIFSAPRNPLTIVFIKKPQTPFFSKIFFHFTSSQSQTPFFSKIFFHFTSSQSQPTYSTHLNRSFFHWEIYICMALCTLLSPWKAPFHQDNLN